MQSTLPPKPSDDPHDVVVVAPDVARVAPADVAPADDELSNLLHQAARYRSETRAGSDVPAGATVPPVDTTFRPAAVNDVLVPRKRWSMVRRAARGLIALLLAACIGLAAVAWRSYGDTAKRQIARWTTQLVLTSSVSPEQSEPAAQPAAAAVAADAANPAPAQPEPPPQSAAEAVAPPAAAPSPDSAQLMQSMARDLASLGQEVEQLKGSIEQLKAGQQQMSRDAARPPDQNLRPRKPAPPPRSAAVRPRRPMPPYPSAQAAAAPAATYPATAPYYAPRQTDYYAPRQQTDYGPRQPESQPQLAAEPPADPELASAPRPPMPVR
jgi:hypothetical protein